MLVVVGLVVLVAAVIVGVAGILENAGSAHAVPGGLTVLGIDVTGSTGTVFLIGIVVGLAAALGLALVLTGARRAARRGTTARRELRQSRRETAAVSEERDALRDRRDQDHPRPSGSP